MQTAENLKEIVREKYGRLARESGSCCGPTSCCGPDAGEAGFVRLNEDYSRLDGYVQEADLGLGCGIPVGAADLQPGQTVVDLGSGAGNDAFIARRSVGESGKVIGVDMTADMIRKARENAAKVGYRNVEFRLGELEALPVETGSVDRVLSNCVLNLVPDKVQAFREMFRILKPGGRFGISDIVTEGELPENLRQAAELYVGCVSGALQKQDYVSGLEALGFEKVRITEEKVLEVPEDLLSAYLTADQRDTLVRSKVRILSVTVQGTKPDQPSLAPKADRETGGSAATEACCTPLASAGSGPCCFK